MNKILTSLMATTLALSMAVPAIAPAAAAPIAKPAVQTQSDVQQVQERRWLKHAERRWDRRDDRREARRDQRALERRGDWYYYNGYRGFRERRNGYRYYNGYYFPAEAFIASALITGAIAATQQPKVIVRRSNSVSTAHVDWCYNRYRSYRASDNTYQPLSGPRAACYSPYD